MTCQISPFLTFQVLKIAAELEKTQTFSTVLEHLFVFHHGKYDGDSPKNNKVIAISALGILTLYNVCSVHRGMFSTSGGVQYIGGYHEYIGGDTMSTSGEYHEYIGGCSVHRRDTMSTSGGVQYIGGIP